MQTILAILKQAGGWHHGLYLKIENPPYPESACIQFWRGGGAFPNATKGRSLGMILSLAGTSPAGRQGDLAGHGGATQVGSGW